MIVILGYYDKSNLGDQTYTKVFPLLLENSDITDEIIFVNPEEIDHIPSKAKIVICGGGDIINDYFNNKFEKVLKGYRGPIYAVSIGITYPATINDKYLGRFSQIYVRHRDYHKELAKICGTEHVFHIPDIAFLLEPYNSDTPQELPEKKKIGVFLANGITINIQDVLVELEKEYDVILYAFNTSDQSHESDVIYYQKYYSDFTLGPVITEPDDMLKEMSQLHFAICVRYHSHIFAMIQNIPFVSIASKPKAQLLMKDSGLEDYMYSFKDKWSPADSGLLLNLIRKTLINRDNMMDKLWKIVDGNRDILESLTLFKDDVKSVEKIYAECQTLIEKGYPHEIVASNALYRITGSVNDKYMFGFVDNLKKEKGLFDMIKWVFEDFFSGNHIDGVKFLQPVSQFAGVHRSGWEFVSKMLKQFEKPDGILCDLYVDGTFHWNEHLYAHQGIIPFKKDWIGFIHHTLNTEFSDYNVIHLFKNIRFKLSLKHCKALIVLSEHLKVWIEKKLGKKYKHVKVFCLTHPTEFNAQTFKYYDFASNPKFVQVGSWLRNPYGIYRAPLKGQKFMLIGPQMNNIRHPPNLQIKYKNDCDKCYKYHPCYPNDDDHCDHCDHNGHDGHDDNNDCHKICRPQYHDNQCFKFILKFLCEAGAPEAITFKDTECTCTNTSSSSLFEHRNNVKITQLNRVIKKNYESVTVLENLDNKQYDKLLTNHVVFLNLVDAAAVNTIIECIVRNTPVIVNRLPATIEYLGKDYPLFYDKFIDLETLDIKTIQKAHTYLTKMDKSRFMIETFVNEFEEILKEI
ncbi:polysaccharide pyruvyl transferase GTB-type glycosyltransferase [Klosneuvirus KNV1]|uniref:Polysaccharide pyruvyl transferase GTB-type glycosyltransferase n=1 Tax=Klosneuvirus KNV1 TaxID=1977640 RepID=A0A1V0SKQ0_9VIRU|nr:polysaccharide pyruvyl transferase GTB-type glycosyltransferase [Klosneuvirus KNV1]